MSTIRKRDNKYQAIVRQTRAGEIIFQESRMFDTERQARAWAADLESRLRAEGADTLAKSRMTFKDLIDKYRKLREEVTPMRRALRGELDQLEYWLGSRSLESLQRPEAWVQFARKRKSAGAGPATIMHNLATASSVFGAAKPAFGIPVSSDSIAGAIQTLKLSGHARASEHRDRRPTADEINALHDVGVRRNRAGAEIDLTLFIPLAIALPRRRNELCEAKWADYDGQVLTLHDTKHPVAPRTERVPVPPAAQALLAQLPRTDARMLPWVPESVSTAFQRAVRDANIHDLRLHDLRHEGICRLFEAGLTIPEVSLISGHESWATLKRYTHIQPEHVLRRLA